MHNAGTLNAYEPMTFVTSQEASIRLSCIQLWRHSYASNVKKVRKQAFQEISVCKSFIESYQIYLLKKLFHSSPWKKLSLHGAMSLHAWSKN